MRSIVFGVVACAIMVGCAGSPASRSYNAGTEALTREDWEMGARHLEEAVRLEPSSSRNHNNLSFAYYKLGLHADSFSQLRQAVLLDPDNAYAVLSFWGQWNSLAKDGRLRLGDAGEQALKSLGEPDLKDVSRDGRDEVWIYANGALRFRDGRLVATHVSVFPLIGGPYGDRPETLAFDLGERGWRPGHWARNNSKLIVEYVLPDETVEAWSELVTWMLDVDAQGFTTPSQVAEISRGLLSKDCPSLIWSIIEEEPDDILIEWRHTGCHGYPAQHELSRHFTGAAGIHRVSYVAKRKKLSGAVREEWIARLSSAAPWIAISNGVTNLMGGYRPQATQLPQTFEKVW